MNRKLQQQLSGNETYDNVYVDMNGVIHPCCHNNGKSEHANEDEMFKAVGEEINYIVKMTRPKKLLYLAIDGVAPRAKMVQQRSRRLRSALESLENQDLEAEFREDLSLYGYPLPSDRVFHTSSWDSNVITPGTRFMLKLVNYLKDHIEKEREKGTPHWGNIQIILSDSSVPGEGEHKVLEYIRTNFQVSDKEPESHCIVGDDADLLMLGLGTHLPNISIIRNTKDAEEHRIQRQQKSRLGRTLVNSKKSFQAEEIQKQQRKESKGYKVFGVDQAKAHFLDSLRKLGIPVLSEGTDRLINDILVLFFLGGNDFVPNLPTLDFRANAVDVILDTYAQTVRQYPQGTYLVDTDLKLNLVFMSTFCSIIDQRVSKFHVSTSSESKYNAKNTNHAQANYLELCNSLQSGVECSLGSHCSQNHGDAVPLDVSVTHLQMLMIKFASDSKATFFKVPDHLLAPVTVELDSEGLLNFENLSIYQRNVMFRTAVKLGIEANTDATSKLQLKRRDSSAWPSVLKDLYKSELLTFIEGQERGHVREAVEEHEKVFGKYIVSVNSETFYSMKLGIDKHTDEGKAAIRNLCYAYVHGLQWILRYYFQGVPCWNWHFTYHYAPLAIDIAEASVKMSIDEVDRWPPSSPISPIQQLMSVLPINSVHALPKPCKDAITAVESPLAPLFPNPLEIQLDPNGKVFRWQWTTLLPLSAPEPILNAVNSTRPLWSRDEKELDGLSSPHIFNPVPGILPPLMVPKKVVKMINKPKGPAFAARTRNAPTVGFTKRGLHSQAAMLSNLFRKCLI